MKSIVLTEEHKSKLLEMCEVLFPEYNDQSEGGTGPINFHHNNLYPGMLFGFKSNGEDGDSYDHASLFIHWFEFVMTHLFYKIYDLWRHEEINCVTIFHLNIHNYYLNTDDKNEKYHPINYLYEQFKLLKQ